MKILAILIALCITFQVSNQIIDIQALINQLCDNIDCDVGFHCYAGSCIQDTIKVDLCQFKSCDLGQKCIKGECKSIKSIDACSLCPAGTICAQNQCTLSSDICRHVACPFNYFCVQGSCFKKQIKCQKSQECPQDYQCSSYGTCQQIKYSYCEQQCVKGSKCIKNECVKLNTQEFTINDQEESKILCSLMNCGEGLECQQGQCIPRPFFSNENCFLYPCQDKEDLCYFGSCIKKAHLNVQDKESNKSQSQGNSSIDLNCGQNPCQKGFSCQNGFCLPDSLFNISNCYISPCPSGKICNFGICKQIASNNASIDNCSNKCTALQSCVNDKCRSINQNMDKFCDGIKCQSNQTCVLGKCTDSRFQDLCKKTSCNSNQLCFFGVCFATTIKKNADACSKVNCSTGAMCANGQCNYLLKVFDGLCDNVKCKSNEVCMYGNCVQQNIKSNCDSKKCDQLSICLLGSCFPIFSSFDIFIQNKSSGISNVSNVPDPVKKNPNPFGDIINPLSSIDLSSIINQVNPSISPDPFVLNSACNPVCNAGQFCVVGRCMKINLQGSNTN